MERIAKLGALMTSAENSPNNAGGNIEDIQLDSRYIIRKSQAEEDLRKAMTQWKSKATISPHSLANFLLGELYPYYKQIVEFNATDLHFKYNEHYNNPKELQRVEANQIFIKLLKKFPVTMEKYENEPWFVTALVGVSGCLYPSSGTKMAIHFGLYCKSIHTLGTQKHLKYLEQGLRIEDIGCFCLTEISHGSNVQGMLTTAIFDEIEKCFVLNTPIERAAKFWIGGASQTANMAIVGANLIVKGKNHGIHMFVVQIRNSKTHDLMPGVNISDCGDKMGLNGIDNGMVFFRNVPIPMEALLDKVTQVTEDGEVTSKFKKSQRFAVQLSGLCDGRVKLLNTCLIIGVKASTILLRYAAVRRQFGAHLSNESSLLDYEAYQHRIFPHIANCLLGFFASREINKSWQVNYSEVLNPYNNAVKEMHAIMSILKPLTTWWINDQLQEYRQAMGGYGFLKLSTIPQLCDDFHVMLTWEGDNNVLLHQTAKFILKAMFKVLSNREVSYKSLEYLIMDDPEDLLNMTGEEFEAQLVNPESLHKLMALRARKAAIVAATTFQGNLTEIVDSFKSWNKSVPFGFLDASMYFGELYVLQSALRHNKSCHDDENRIFIDRLTTIFSLTKLLKGWTHLGAYMNGDHVAAMHKVLLKTYDAIKHDVVKAMDGFAINDEFANSVFGNQDGNMYGRLFSKIHGEQSNFGKPKEWKEMWENRHSY